MFCHKSIGYQSCVHPCDWIPGAPGRCYRTRGRGVGLEQRPPVALVFVPLSRIYTKDRSMPDMEMLEYFGTFDGKKRK